MTGGLIPKPEPFPNYRVKRGRGQRRSRRMKNGERRKLMVTVWLHGYVKGPLLQPGARIGGAVLQSVVQFH